MAKKKGARKKGRSKRQASRLDEHQRHKKTLTPPMLTLPAMTSVSWVRDHLPDLLWVATMIGRRGNWQAAYRPLEVLDEFVPEGPMILDGRLSRFALVSEDQRAEARRRLETEAPHALPARLGHALGLYPQCPALWLYEDWLAHHEPDPEIGLELLKAIFRDHGDRHDVTGTRMRMIVIGRMFKHNKIVLSSEMPTVELLPKYPTGLSEDEQRQVEGFSRAMYNSFSTGALGDDAVGDGWRDHFWRRSSEVSACEVTDGSDDESADEDPEVEDRGESAGYRGEATGGEAGDLGEATDDGEEEATASNGEGRGLTLALLQGVESAIAELGRELRAAQAQLTIDLYRPAADEVKLGLASRQYRLLNYIATTPRLWTGATAAHFVRSMVELRITTAWLLQQNDPELYERYQEYGRGKLKLFKLQLEELHQEGEDSADEPKGVDDDGDEVDGHDKGVDGEYGHQTDGYQEDEDSLHLALEAEVNQDIMEEFQKIDLGGNFAGRSLHKMAEETGLQEVYSLSYQPLSGEAHGEWPSLDRNDMTRCRNPLHLYHRLGTFAVPDRIIGSEPLLAALDLAETTITEIFADYGTSLDSAFERCHDAIDESLSTA